MSGTSANEIRNTIDAYLILNMDELEEYNRPESDARPEGISQGAQSAMAELVRLAGGQSEIVRELIQGSLSGTASTNPGAGGYLILVRVLGQVDESAEELNRLISAGGVHPAIQAAAVHELGKRNEPALLVPLIRRLQGGRWWRRRLNAIMDRVAGPDALDDVSTAIVQEMGRNHIVEALPALRARQKTLDGHDHLGCWDRAELLNARGQLGDREALPALIELGYTQGTCAQLGREGLDALCEEMGGHREVITALEGSPCGEDLPTELERLARNGMTLPIRLWAQAALVQIDPEAARPLIFERLGDKDWWVANRSCSDLCALPESARRGLDQLAADPEQDRNRRLWAVYALVQLGLEATEIWESIPDGQVHLSDQIPAIARRAALCSWSAGRIGIGTDVRWLIEAEIAHGQHPISDQLRRGQAQQETADHYERILTSAGLTGSTLTPYEQIEGYGMATFFVVKSDGSSFCISKCEPCCGAYDQEIFAPLESADEAEVPSTLRARLDEAGLIWLNSDILATTLPALFVPDWSGDREATLGELIFSLLVY
jgi:hypothetical protein